MDNLPGDEYEFICCFPPGWMLLMNQFHRVATENQYLTDKGEKVSLDFRERLCPQSAN